MSINIAVVIVDGKRTTHIPDAHGNYATLCGLDDDDSEVGHAPGKAVRGDKINCAHCWAIWQVATRYKASNFTR